MLTIRHLRVSTVIECTFLSLILVTSHLERSEIFAAPRDLSSDVSVLGLVQLSWSSLWLIMMWTLSAMTAIKSIVFLGGPRREPNYLFRFAQFVHFMSMAAFIAVFGYMVWQHWSNINWVVLVFWSLLMATVTAQAIVIFVVSDLHQQFINSEGGRRKNVDGDDEAAKENSQVIQMDDDSDLDLYEDDEDSGFSH